MISAFGLNASGKIENVTNRSGAERIDRLGVVADHCEAAPSGLHGQQDRGLQPVGVLVFVDQHMIEAAADVVGDCRIGHHLGPVEQEVVVVEHVVLLFGFNIRGEQLLELSGPAGAPRIGCAEHFFQLGLGVDTARIDREARTFRGEAALGLRQAAFVPDEIHQVGRVLAVVDGESGIESDLVGIFAKQPGADAVKCSGPAQRIVHEAGLVA